MIAPPGSDTPFDDKITTSPPTKRWNQLLVGLVTILLWLCLLTPPSLNNYIMPSGRGFLDTSWQLANAYFLEHHLRAGIDFVFPTTVLGFFLGPVCLPSLFWPYLCWQLGLASLLTWNIAAVAARYPHTPSRIGLLVLCAFSLPLYVDSLYYALLIMIAGTLLFPKGVSSYRQTLNIVAMVLLSLEKFSFLVFAFLILGVGLAHSISQNRDTRLRWCVYCTAFGILFVCTWLGLHQHLSDLPLFFHNLLMITAGYNTSMGRPGIFMRSVMGFAILVPFIPLLLISARPSGQSVPNVAASLLLGILIFQGWKHGFVRNDDHATIFYSLCAFYVAMLPVFFGKYKSQSRWYLALGTIVIAVSLISQVVILKRGHTQRFLVFWMKRPLNNAALVLMPFRAQRDLEKEFAGLQQTWALPEVREQVQKRSIDVLSVAQHVLILNLLEMHNRPVYQSYSAYTPSLAEMNADFYRGSQSPDFVLLHIQLIDQHYAMQEDNLALLEILKRYHPILVEKGMPLLARNEAFLDVGATIYRSSQEVRLHFSEPFRLHDGLPFHLLTLAMVPRFPQKIASVLLRPTPVYLVVEDDQGHSHRYRLSTETARSGFLLDPIVQDTRDFLSLYTLRPLLHVRSFHLEEQSKGAYSDPVSVTVTGLSRITGEALDEATIHRLFSPDRWVYPPDNP